MVPFFPSMRSTTSALFLYAFARQIRIDPLGEGPLALWHDLEYSLAASGLVEVLYKALVPGLVVEKQDGVVKPLVEVLLDGLNRLLRPVPLLIPRQHDEDGILALGSDVGLLAGREERRVEVGGRSRDAVAPYVYQGFEDEGGRYGQDEREW